MVFRGIHWTNLSWPFRVIGNYFLKMYKYIPSLKYYEKCAVKSSVTFDWIVQIYYYTHYFSILSPVWMGFGIFPEFHFYFFSSHLRVYNTKNYKNKCKTYKSQLPVSIEDKENPGQFKVEERNVRLFHDDTFQSFYRRLGKLF